jgi:hypothetical protein
MFGRPPKSPERINPLAPIPATEKVKQNQESATELKNAATRQSSPQPVAREIRQPPSRNNTPPPAPAVRPTTPASSTTWEREEAQIAPTAPSATPLPQTDNPQNQTERRNRPTNFNGIKKENAWTIFSRMENENRDIPEPTPPIRPVKPADTTTKRKSTTSPQPEAPRSTPSSQRIWWSSIRDEGGIPWSQSAEERQRIISESRETPAPTTPQNTNQRSTQETTEKPKIWGKATLSDDHDLVPPENRARFGELRGKPHKTQEEINEMMSYIHPERNPSPQRTVYKPTEPAKPTEPNDFEVTTQEGKEGQEQKEADEAHVKSRRLEARKNLEKENGWNNLNTQEQAEKIDAHLAAEDETNKQILKTQMEYARDSEKKKQDVVDPNDTKLKAIQKEKPLVEEKLPEATTLEQPGEQPQATKENGKATPPTIEPTKVTTPGDAALDGFLNGDDAAITREMRRDRDFMANMVEKAQDKLIDAFSEKYNTDVRKTINEAGTSDQLHQLKNIDRSHHGEIGATTKDTLKKVMSGYYQYRPEIRGWTDRSGSIVILPAEHKEAVGKFLRATAPDHPYGKLTAENNPYEVTRWNNPFQGAELDPRIHGNIVDFNAQIGAHRPFQEELKHIRERLKILKPQQEGLY